MVALAAASRTYRRPALASASIATLLAVSPASMPAAPVTTDRRPSPQRPLKAPEPSDPAGLSYDNNSGRVRQRRHRAAQRQHAVRDVLHQNQGRRAEDVKSVLRLLGRPKPQPST